MSDLITKLVPILHVKDPSVERRFYEQLGLCTTYEGPEYPGLSRSVMTSSSLG